MTMTPVFFAAGDANKDQKLSKTELTDLAAKWFTAWDKDKLGKLTTEQVRSGLNETIQANPVPDRPAFRLQGPEG